MGLLYPLSKKKMNANICQNFTCALVYDMNHFSNELDNRFQILKEYFFRYAIHNIIAIGKILQSLMHIIDIISITF